MSTTKSMKKGLTKLIKPLLSIIHVNIGMAGHSDPATTDHYKRVSRLGSIDTDSWNEMFG